jgi:hypothetical protein
MLTLERYIDQMLTEPVRRGLARKLSQARQNWSVKAGKDPVAAFGSLVNTYIWLGQTETKQKYNIAQNLARNLPGALLQDYLIEVVIKQLEPYPSLEIFTEVRVPFGRYPIWEGGNVAYQSPAQLVDLAVGYRMVEGEIMASEKGWPQEVVSSLPSSEIVIPLIVVNSKIRVSQSEFFDYLGREQLLTKGNPTCMSVEVALRSEMDLSIVAAAKATDNFFLLGTGGERTVTARPLELARFVEEVREHLGLHMMPHRGTDVD